VNFRLDVALLAYSDQGTRRTTIETKGTSLVAGLGITISFLAGAGAIVFTQVQLVSGLIFTPVVILCVLLLASLVYAFRCAVKTLSVEARRYLDPHSILDEQNIIVELAGEELIASLMRAYDQTLDVNDVKAAWLNDGFQAFVVSIALAIVITALISVNGLIVGDQRVSLYVAGLVGVICFDMYYMYEMK
jgi:hypothetical protein